MSIGRILFDLRAGTAKMDADFKKANRKIGKSLASIDGMFKKAAGALSVYFGGRALVGLVNASAQAGVALNDMAQRTGIGAEALQELRYAGDMAGVSVSDMDASLQRFNRRLGAAANGNEAMAGAFKSAGLSIRDAGGKVKDADTLFMELADQMAKLPNDAQRAAHGMNLFGDAGLRMGPLFKGGAAGLRAMREEAAKYGIMSAEAVQASARFSDNLKRVTMIGKGVRDSIVQGLLPALEGITGWMLDAGGGSEKYAKITEWTSRALDILADSADVIVAKFREFIDPLLAMVSGMSQAEIASMSVADAIAAMNKSIDGTSKALAVASGALKILWAGALSVGTLIEIIGRALGALGAAIAQLVSGDIQGMRRAVAAMGDDVIASTRRTADQIAGMWSDSMAPVELATGKAGGFREALERVREAGKTAGASLRGAAPAIEATGAASDKAAKAAEALAAKLQAAGFATRALVAQASGDRLAALEVQYSQEIAALDKSLHDKEILQSDYDAQRTAREALYLQEVEALRIEADRRTLDADVETRGILAGLTESRLDDLKLSHEREMEAVRRLEEDKTLTAEEGARRRLALQAQYTRDVTDEMRAESEAATATGLGIADAIASGLREGFSSTSFRDIFKSLLTMFSRIASLIPGGQVAGGVSGIFAGMFADGGEVGGSGTGTSDSNLALVSKGEFINRASSVRKFGAEFFKRLNEGVLDLTALPRYATGGIVGSSPAPALAGATGVGGTTIYQTMAFDPRSMLEVIGSSVEPAQYRRGVARADAKAIEGMRRRVRAPRAGRVV